MFILTTWYLVLINHWHLHYLGSVCGSKKWSKNFLSWTVLRAIFLANVLWVLLAFMILISLFLFWLGIIFGRFCHSNQLVTLGTLQLGLLLQYVMLQEWAIAKSSRNLLSTGNIFMWGIFMICIFMLLTFFVWNSNYDLLFVSFFDAVVGWYYCFI